MDALEKEYDTLLQILSGSNRDTVIDCATTANKGICQVTFADIEYVTTRDGQSAIKPRETVITGADDL